MPTVVAAQLRHRLTLQDPPDPDVVDDYGRPSGDWTDALICRGDIRALTGRELFEAQAAEAEVEYEVTIRWHKGVYAKQRFVTSDGKTLYITSVSDPDQRRRMLTCLCSEQPPQS